MKGYKNFESSPTPGALRQRVTIWKRHFDINAMGQPVTRKEKIATVWANVIDGGWNSIVAGEMRTIDDMLNVTIRWRNDIELGMLVEFDGQMREITQMGRYEYRKAYLGMKCQLTEAVGT